MLLLSSRHPVLHGPTLISNPRGPDIPADVRERRTGITWDGENANASSDYPKLVVEKLGRIGYLCRGRAGSNVHRVWILSKGPVRGVLSLTLKVDWFKAPEDCPEDDVDWAPAEMQQIIDKRNNRKRALQPIDMNKI